jgi:hypothetical protein
MKTPRQQVCAAVILFFRHQWSPEAIARKFSWEIADVERFIEAARNLFRRDRCREVVGR